MLTFSTLPSDVVLHIRAFIDSFVELFVLRHALSIPDLFWRRAATRSAGKGPNLMANVRSSKKKPLVWHFEHKVLPRLCRGCGRTTQCKRHDLLQDTVVCRVCTDLPRFRVLSKTRAMHDFFLDAKHLPCTLWHVKNRYLYTEIERCAVQVHGSLDAVERFREQQRQRREERRVKRLELAQARLRRRQACLASAYQRAQDLDQLTGWSTVVHATRSYHWVIGDYLCTNRSRPDKCFMDVLRDYERVLHLYQTAPVEVHGRIGPHLAHGLPLQPSTVTQKCRACQSNTGAKHCGLCRACCRHQDRDCLRHGS